MQARASHLGDTEPERGSGSAICTGCWRHKKFPSRTPRVRKPCVPVEHSAGGALSCSPRPLVQAPLPGGAAPL